MRTVIKLSSLLLLTISIVGCSDFENQETQLALKEYGKWEHSNESLNVELQLNRFEDFDELFSRTERIVCNDSIPKITLKLEKEIKTIYLHNPCWDQVGCILIRENNVIKIHNDTVIKAKKTYPLDDLKLILKKDIENRGSDPEFSDNPKNLVISISYDIEGIEKLSNTLNLLTESYEELTDKRDMNIWLEKRIEGSPTK